MKFRVLTLFPEMVKATLKEGVVGQSVQNGELSLELVNPRDFAEDSYQRVDDRPFGGGDGMVMMIDPLAKALKSLADKNGPVVYLSPQGKVWNDQMARTWAKEYSEVTLICGRYAGVDQRFINRYVDAEISIGDYVISGGELAAMVLMDSVARHLPGVLGNPISSDQDSFQTQCLEGPIFTRPSQHELGDVPEFLTSGNHSKISQIRRAVSLALTRLRRPDLLENATETPAWIEVAQTVLALNEGEKNALGFSPIELSEMKKWK